MAEGDIGTVLGSLEFDATKGQEPDIIHIAGTVYAIAYRGNGNTGWIKTVTISADGATIALAGGSLEFDTNVIAWPDIIHISGTVYAIAYRGAGNDGYIKTVTISADGATIALASGSLAFDAAWCDEPHLIHVAGLIYAVAYTGASNNAYVATVSISNDGATLSVTDGPWALDTAECLYLTIIHVAGNTYAVVYMGAGSDCVITTIEIASNGTISDPVIATIVVDSVLGGEPDIIHVAGDVYAIAYRGTAQDGYIKTVTISAAGALALVGGGVLEFDTVNCVYADFAFIDGTLYVIAYRGDGDDGYAKTVTISADGATIALAGGVREFETANITVATIIHVAGDVHAIAYALATDPGWLKTVGIEGPPAGRIKYLTMMGVG